MIHFIVAARFLQEDEGTMNGPENSPLISRRILLQATVLGGFSRMTSASVGKEGVTEQTNQAQRTYAAHAKGIRIIPGQWRPHYPWEHIAWVSPSWPSQDYIWLDFPEAIFTRQGLLYLSHVNPQVEPVVFPDQPAVQWHKVPGGIAYERSLPNKITFGGKITAAKNSVDLEIFIRNGSSAPLNDIKLQTCFFLRAIREFSAYTAENKYVHVPGRGWMPFAEARRQETEKGRYRLGWRSGPRISDLPIMVTLSSTANRLIACTWGKDTYSLICNPDRPCMHADPAIPNVSPGQSAVIRGILIFFEGSLGEFTEALHANRLEIPL